MANNIVPSIHTATDVANARTKGQVVGWLQGFAVGVVGMILLGMIGWIPTLAVLGVVGFLVYKLVAGSSKPGA